MLVAGCASSTPDTGPRATASCGEVRVDGAGRPAPLTCPGGAPSAEALDYFRQQGLVVVDLDPQATGSQVVNGLCADLARGTSRAVLRDAYTVAAARGRWDFGVDPTSDTQLDACS